MITLSTPLLIKRLSFQQCLHIYVLCLHFLNLIEINDIQNFISSSEYILYPDLGKYNPLGFTSSFVVFFRPGNA